jgi:ABC-type multidrug transport system fused ATPase/permease subunit
MKTLNQRTEMPVVDYRPSLQVTQGTIRVEQVSFVHSDGTRALHGVSLEAQRGEVIALVGPNGAGKSTLIDLLMGFAPPRSGRIVIDGQDIQQVALDSLRRRIGLVSQDAPLFDGTVAQNIAYGVRQGAPEECIQRAAALVGLDRAIARMPEGWETRVGPGGRMLSGGQRQLIALARALADDPPILILDEASAALDAAVEKLLATTIRSLAATKTIIISAHRPATLAIADRIYVLEQGRLIEQGDHGSLMKASGLYARLFQQKGVLT